MYWRLPIGVSLLVAASPCLCHPSGQLLYTREAEIRYGELSSHAYAPAVGQILYVRDGNYPSFARRWADASPAPGVIKPKTKPAGKIKSSLNPTAKERILGSAPKSSLLKPVRKPASALAGQGTTSSAQVGLPPIVPHNTHPVAGTYPPPSTAGGTTGSLPLPNTAPAGKEPWYKTKKGVTTAALGVASGTLGVASSQVPAPYNHALGAASGAAGIAGALTHFLPGKRSLEVMKRRNAVEMRHVMRSLEILEKRDRYVDALLARHE